MNDALTKVITTPHHVYMSETAAYTGGVARTSEMISAPNGTIYIRLHDKWQVSPETAAGMLQQRRENLASEHNASCQLLRQESVNGEGAAVYKIHSESEGAKVDSQIWISKTKGLPLRQEIDIDVGGSGGKSHHQMRFDYADVKPPQM